MSAAVTIDGLRNGVRVRLGFHPAFSATSSESLVVIQRRVGNRWVSSPLWPLIRSRYFRSPGMW
ncbi:hypothetical protein HD595_006285 [Nonomuraea roseoviolacea subsp. carminata]|uniref:Uncharacterized protein n=1 Tax=Nonomuraea roseoviolacea subsp. carminata TaxID=160689 RepID=A0ABT1K843_9ACTN|nr:hypothetical protein [Nonomuraea roseoviolacea subsp. carminata]